jgi:glutathione S-transferase
MSSHSIAAGVWVASRVASVTVNRGRSAPAFGGFQMQCNIERPTSSVGVLSISRTTSATYRAELKRDLKAGRVLLDDVLDSDDPLLASMAVYDLLVAVPGFARVRRWFARCGTRGSASHGGWAR